jgi:NADH-quinone oxidoreductase subunit G
VGGKAGSIKDLLADAASGAIEAVLVLGGPSAEDAAALAPLRSLKTIVTLASNACAFSTLASVLVPVTSVAEMDGTFVNAKGMAQRFERAIRPAEGVRPAWDALLEIAKLLGKPLEVRHIADIRKALPVASQEARA